MTAGRIILFFVFLFLFGGFSRIALGQRATISTWSGSDDITIRSVGMEYNRLNFNQHSNKITANSGTFHIRKEDNNAAIFEIVAPSEFQLAINLDYSQYLAKEGDFSTDGSIPIVLYMAYHNQNAPNETVAKKESIDLPSGTTGITIPVNSRFVVPLSRSEYGGNMERPKSVVYLFVFGTLGPIRSVTAGNYSSQISIHVNAADEKK
jgi:hypothetical protein